jgi:dTMP kinase
MEIYKKFISFEGIDFSGKSTQINLLIKNLNSVGIYPVIFREPGGTKISEMIRDILLSKKHSEMIDQTEILLYEAARAQLVHEKILPLLKSDKYIIADRFYDSTTAYQGFGRNIDFSVVQVLNNFATSYLKPYKTFFIDISAQLAQKRSQKNKDGLDRLESSGIDFFQKIRDGFLKLCEMEPERFILIDGEKSIDEISEKIWTTVKIIWEI